VKPSQNCGLLAKAEAKILVPRPGEAKTLASKPDVAKILASRLRPEGRGRGQCYKAKAEA